MDLKNIETLSQATNELLKHGYKESFTAGKNAFETAVSKNEYSPDQLTIKHSFRFDGMTNPADETQLFALEAKDGTKGVLVMSYSAEHNQNIELIKKLESKN